MRLLLLFLTFIISQQSFAAYDHGYYYCTGIQSRESSPSKVLDVDSKLFIKLRADEEGRVELRAFVGDLTLANQFIDKNNEFNSDSYYANFGLYKIMNQKNYKPRVYLGHVKFANINATGTMNSEGSMWGSFMFDMHEGFVDTVKAHYVFQTGENRGGTIDYLCKKSEFY